MKAPSLTIGIEEEYQIIDPVSGDLRSYITQILEHGKLTLREQVKAEMHQSMVEVGTDVCKTPAEITKTFNGSGRTGVTAGTNTVSKP